jgi:hypothetical protein
MLRAPKAKVEKPLMLEEEGEMRDVGYYVWDYAMRKVELNAYCAGFQVHSSRYVCGTSDPAHTFRREDRAGEREAGGVGILHLVRSRFELWYLHTSNRNTD